MEEYFETVTYCSVCGGGVTEMMYTDGHMITRDRPPPTRDYNPQIVPDIDLISTLSAARIISHAETREALGITDLHSIPLSVDVPLRQQKSETEEVKEEGLVDVLRTIPIQYYVTFFFAVMAAIIILT